MNKIIISTLSCFLALCISGSTIAWGERIQANEADLYSLQQRATRDDIRQYDIDLQPGQHLIIVNVPTRRIIKIDNEQHQTLSVKAASSMVVPFVHLKIEKPSIAPPLQRVSAL